VITTGSDVDALIRTFDGCAFAAIEFRGKQWFLACGGVIDVSEPLEKGYFDVSDYFFSAVPIVIYLRYSFSSACQDSAEHGACVIIDDPVLRTRYGFVDFRRLSGLAVEHNFSYNVAFIPWNWARSQLRVLDIFKRQANRLSISIHGCDHTAAEFAARSAASINTQAKLALARMEKHAGRTGLNYDPLMIFPQGVFSTVALSVLKHNGFIAAVNTDVLPTDAPRGTQIGDTWQMAVTRYADFPIFTRRYAFHGIHNFAFDLLLGKPCLMVTHHLDFRNDSMDVMAFIDKLNALPDALKWRPLGDVIRHAYQVQLSNDVYQIRMFGSEIVLTNDGLLCRRAAVEKVERDLDAIEGIEANGRKVAFMATRRVIRFELDLPARSNVAVKVLFKDVYGPEMSTPALVARGKIAARRYLSEFRDESQARVPFVYKYASKAKAWIAH